MNKEEKASYIRNKAMYDLKQAGLTHTELAEKFGVPKLTSWRRVACHRKIVKEQEGAAAIEAQKYADKSYHERNRAVKLEEIQPDLFPIALPEDVCFKYLAHEFDACNRINP